MPRPLKYKDTKQIEKIIEDYFTDCDNRKAPYTMIGLSNALDISRMQLYRYSDYKMLDESDIRDIENITEDTKKALCYIISRAVDRIEQFTVEKLYSNDTYKGAQFILACNYNYRQTQAIEIQSEKDINITVSD